VPTSIFSPVYALRERSRGRITDRKAGAVFSNPVAVRDSNAAGRSIPGENHVACGVDAVQLGNLTIIGGSNVRFELQLLEDVGHPAGAEAFPCQHGDRLRSEQCHSAISTAPVSDAGTIPSR
jgi:hypothetical protein